MIEWFTYGLLHILLKSNDELGLKEKRVMPPTPAEVIKENEKKTKKEETKPEEKKLEDSQITLFQEVSK